MNPGPEVDNPDDKSSLFPPTRWSLVLQAQQGSGPAAAQALADLCKNYWYPLYAFARSRGLSPHDAEDSTQAFFQRFLANQSLDTAAADRGRLRAFLLASMKNFLSSQWREQNALKRGGGALQISIDQDWAEGNLGAQLAHADGEADTLFDRTWAFSLLNTVSDKLQAHYDQTGKREVYEAIKDCLDGDGSYQASQDLAASLGMTPEAVRSAVFKLRRRFREYVEDTVKDTCATPEDAREEIAHLCKILAQ